MTKKATRLSKAQAAFLEDQDAKRAIQALDERMEMKLDQQARDLELERQAHDAEVAAQEYRARRVAEESAARTIASQFTDYITGSTPGEIEASIALAQAKTAEIMAEMQEAQKQAREQQPRDELGRSRSRGSPRWTSPGCPTPSTSGTATA